MVPPLQKRSRSDESILCQTATICPRGARPQRFADAYLFAFLGDHKCGQTVQAEAPNQDGNPRKNADQAQEHGFRFEELAELFVHEALLVVVIRVQIFPGFLKFSPGLGGIAGAELHRTSVITCGVGAKSNRRTSAPVTSCESRAPHLLRAL